VLSNSWDERYRGSELVWGGRPNCWVERELADSAPGRGLDLGCGEGRNALWLASRGWRMTAVDFSDVGLAKARAIEARQAPAPGVPPVEWVCADAASYRHPQPADLALLCYLHLVAGERRAAVRNSAAALAPGGTLLVIGHDSANLTEGVGGPQDASVLFTAGDIEDDLTGTGLVIEAAGPRHRQVEGATRPAIDAVVRAHHPW
jgi:SAM-dependent methyltransferase